MSPHGQPAKPSGKRPKAAERILRAAQELFYTQGIRAVGTDEIVRKADANKPSLYRAFNSKDGLAEQCIHAFEASFWERFDSAMAQYPGNPRAGLIEFLERIIQRTRLADYRGCGMSNSALEYPDRDYPARRAVEQHKTELRNRLTDIAGQMGASNPQALGDGLMLLIEGASTSGQIFVDGGPTNILAVAANNLIDTFVQKPVGGSQQTDA
jgi:Transcriptional regulator